MPGIVRRTTSLTWVCGALTCLPETLGPTTATSRLTMPGAAVSTSHTSFIVILVLESKAGQWTLDVSLPMSRCLHRNTAFVGSFNRTLGTRETRGGLCCWHAHD